jgi:hypothetical protein
MSLYAHQFFVQAFVGTWKNTHVTNNYRELTMCMEGVGGVY